VSPSQISAPKARKIVATHLAAHPFYGNIVTLRNEMFLGWQESQL
jgi:hypothetical protein